MASHGRTGISRVLLGSQATKVITLSVPGTRLPLIGPSQTKASALMVAPVNDAIAGKLREMAEVLEQQQADVFRIAAYRRATDTLEMLRQPVEQIVRIEGLPGLVELPGIGRGIGSAIVEMVTAGRWSYSSGCKGSSNLSSCSKPYPG